MMGTINNTEKYFVERRRYRRICTVLPVKLKIERQLEEGNTVNLAERGLCVCVERAIPKKIATSNLNIQIYLSRYYPRIEAETKIIWKRQSSGEKIYYGMRFENISKENSELIKKILAEPKIKFLQPYGAICTKMHGVDLTIGCDLGCIYCHYKDWVKDKYPAHIDQAFDISPIYKIRKFPKVIYLSPYSDPFSIKAKNLAYDLMSFFLPKGICIWILTKAIIPDNIITLIGKYPSQVEVGVGITSFDKKRNGIIEPNCPSAEERLTNLQRLKNTGCRYGIRMDPLIPLIDDDVDTLKKTIKKFAELEIKELVSSYLIIPASLLWKLKRISFLQKTLKLFTDKSPTTAGSALSIPLEIKKEKYSKMYAICQSYGITFRICGCREQLIKEAEYLISCR